MPESSDRKPKDGETGDGKGKFDEVWDALVERASVEGASDEQASTRDGAHDATEPSGSQQPTEPEPRTGATKPWDAATRAKLMEATTPEPTESQVEKNAATKPWDDAARALAKEAGPIAARSADDLKMDALMAEAEAAKRRKAAEEAAQQEAPAPQKAGGARRTTWLDRSNDLLERSDELMERIMTEPPPDPPRASKDDDDAVDTKGSTRRPPAQRREHGDRNRGHRESDDGTKAAPPPRPEAGAGRNRIWILLIAIFGLFGIWALLPDPPTRRPVEPTLDADRPAVPLGPAAEHPGAPPRPGPVSLDTSPLIERGPHEGEPERVQPPAEEPTAPPPEEPSTDLEPEADPTPIERETPPEPQPRVDAGDVRTPPAGTASEHAEAFRRLPVASGDGPAIGGVGEGGVHLDHISLGSGYEGGTCTGKLDDFSISDRDRVNVCLRVVHPRVKEEIVVLWQKDGDTIRRSKLTIPDTHAYKTRAYLVLREQYIGRWVVRVLSARGVELASHEFQVVQ